MRMSMGNSKLCSRHLIELSCQVCMYRMDRSRSREVARREVCESRLIVNGCVCLVAFAWLRFVVCIRAAVVAYWILSTSFLIFLYLNCPFCTRKSSARMPTGRSMLRSPRNCNSSCVEAV